MKPGSIGLAMYLAAVLVLPSFAEDDDAKLPRSPVTKIGEHLYRVGEVTIDAKTRELRLPVTVNMREGGPIEYVLVHETGKVHEAIFTTAVSPLSLQIAMKLLRYKSGNGDVFNSLLAPEVLEKEGGTADDRGEEVAIRFLQDGKEPAPVAHTIIDGERAEPMTDGPWTYTGSTVENSSFAAEAEGSIVAIYLDHLAMFNMTRQGADIDDRWGANSKAIPEIGAKGVLIFSPAKKDVTN